MNRLDNEIWVSVANCDGYYISNLGRVKSTRRKQEKILKPLDTVYGYKRVALHNRGDIKFRFIHRLVAEAFIDNPNNLQCVNHKDENKANNEVTNLEWCTFKENTNYGTRNIRAGLSNRDKRNVVVLQIKCNKVIKRWKSAKSAGASLGICPSNITKCCRNKRKSAGGYEWSYERKEITR